MPGSENDIEKTDEDKNEALHICLALESCRYKSIVKAVWPVCPGDIFYPHIILLI
jgi:hypothetical protein